jgi:hypothetical protein
VNVNVVNSNEIPKGSNLFKVSFTTPSPDSLRATFYTLTDSTKGEVLFTHGADFDSAGIGPVGDGLMPLVRNSFEVTVDSTRTGWDPGFLTTAVLKATYQPVLPINQKRPGFPDDITITFDDVVLDTGLAIFPVPVRYAKFKVVAHTPQGDVPLDFRFRDNAPIDSTLDRAGEFIDIVTYAAATGGTPQITWRIELEGPPGSVRPGLGDVYQLRLKRPLSSDDVFVFSTSAQRVDASLARDQSKQEPYVVPNPYIGSASFEPRRFAESGRGDRRIEFRAVPLNATIRIYTVRGDLVQTLRQSGSMEGFVAWNVRTRDNLDLAPGLYIYQVEAPGAPTHTGKFAVIK